MGLRFDMRTANWLAYLLQPNANVPSLDNPWSEKEALRIFLKKLDQRFMSSPAREDELGRKAKTALQMLDALNQSRSDGIPPQILTDLRGFLGNRPWIALVLPSGRDHGLDRFLCSKKFLRRLVNIRSVDPGIILQLEQPPEEAFSLTDVFPAFRTALAESNRWPGILLWNQKGDSVFLPFISSNPLEIERRAYWIISHLATTRGVDPELLLQQYRHEFPDTRRQSRATLNIIHLSDLHIGSKEAGRRIPRVQQLIRNLLDELGDESTLVPVVTGDIMDSPNERCLDSVRSFMDFLSNLGTEAPITILGNHDVRRDGYLAENFKLSMKLPGSASRVVWYDECRVGLACFNSVIAGRLARGFIGEQQLVDIGNEIDRKRHWKEYALIAALHHHPTPVERPDWYAQPFYERLLGSKFEKTDALEDADSFVNFAEEREMAAIIHGHKHIPRIAKTPRKEIPIYGCGSTVSKVSTEDGGTYMSINIVSLDGTTGQLTGRLLAERIPGGGLSEYKRHEVIHRMTIRRSLVA